MQSRRGSKVREEVDDTIDGAIRAEPQPRAGSAPSDGDYPELVTIDRRHYVFRGEIAKGGMGRVLEARDLRLGRSVAIKELLPKNRDAARRFEREARITARLQHPAIINVYEAGVWPGGEPFYAMQKVAGRSLAQVVGERATLEQRIGLLPNVIAVADALAYAHSQDVVHRDLKPSNVLVGEFGETVVIDWGLAKDLAAPADPAMSLEMRARPEETLSGSVVGTPAYMPPEQARGEPVDHRADVYALGALLYKVLVGHAPYQAASSNDVVQQVLDGSPRPVDEREPGAPPDLVAIVNKAMARDPAARYPTAAELAADLKRFQTGQLVAAHHYTRRQLIVRWLERHRVAVAIAAVAVTVFAVFGTLTIRKIIAEKERAETEQRKSERSRAVLLEERGRAELLAGRAGPALAYLAAAVHDEPTGALSFLIAEAMRPFEAQIASVPAGEGRVLVAYRPDGTEFATASADGLVKTWDTAGKQIRELDRGHGRVSALAWSPNSELLATGGDDGKVRVWKASGAVVRELAAHTGAVADLSFSPDGKRLVSASADHTARLWDVETGSSTVIARPESTVTVARFSPEGMRVIYGTELGDAEVWGETTTPDSPLRAHTGRIQVARWSPRGDLILTASADGTARIWDPESGKAIALPIRHKADVSIEDAVWSHDGRRIITAGSDHVARVWLVPPKPAEGDVPAVPRELAQLPHADRVTHAEFSLDDRWVVTAGNDRYVRVWDAKGQPIAMFEHASQVVSVEMSPDGTTVIVGCRDGTARIWDLLRGISRASQSLASPIHTIAVASDGRVAVGADDSHVWWWKANGAKNLLSQHMGTVWSVAFSHDGRMLATAGYDDAVFVWAAGETKPRLALAKSTERTFVAFGRDDSIVAADDTGKLWIWSATGVSIASIDTKAAILALAVHSGSGAIVTASATGIDIWSASGEHRSHRASTPARALAFDVSGRFLAISTATETVVTAFASERTRDVAVLDGATSDIAAVTFNRDASLLFTGGTDGVVRVWDAAKGKPLATRDTGGGGVEALALQGDELLWTANTDGVARALEVQALRDPSTLKTFIASKVPWRLGDDDVVRPTK